MKALLVVMVAVLCVPFVHASLRVGENAIAPKNNLWIPVGDKANNGLTEEQFNSVLDRVFNIYIPLAKIKKAELINERDWEDGTVNSYASQQGKTWTVASFGGLARYNAMTEDAFALVACHEIGHHMGGAPKYKKFGSFWASSEGEADYYGTLKCMKRYLESEDNLTFVANANAPQIVSQKCQMSFSSEKDVALCIRCALAGKVLARVLSELKKVGAPDFSTPDKNVVRETLYNDYPAIQCRFDTYFAGALCNKSVDDDMSSTDPRAGSCNDGLGMRPLCWYAHL